ncbi:GNAT family N-acetyltransferase [Arthrobacter sp. AQ5-05]|uniref:GNAT family N-acetyltransferase n=1 Tax=Arthrobacter sp. AQ5-05 TaxID=2184581 RepID=UPI0012B66624|nr:GNAT family N-acetyltransferase [Arthrobacter sp. AQ5-05]
MTLSLRPMTAEQLQDWLLWCLEDYAQDRMRSGESAELARANSAADNAKYFPDGEPAEGHLVNELVADGEVVGFLWIGPESTARDGAWWVWDIGVHSQHRGQGFGRAAMLLAEAEAKRRGGKELGLHVFGFSTVARTLYDSLGYLPTSITMAKTLS